MTRDEYLDLADKAYAACLAAQEAGDKAAALRMLDVAEYYRQRALTAGKRSPIIAREPAMTDAHRQAISEATLQNQPMKAARKAGLRTLSDVAAALGKIRGETVGKSFLSQVFSGGKKMPPDIAEAFESLTGYPASRWKS